MTPPAPRPPGTGFGGNNVPVPGFGSLPLPPDPTGSGSVEDLIASFTDGRTAAEVEHDPELRLAMCRALAAHSPAGLALVASRGHWQLAKHHAVIDDAIRRAIQKREGRIIISVSVRAGKSVLAARYASAWYLGTHPDHQVMLGAHEAGFSSEHSGFSRDVLTEYGNTLYGVAVDPASSARNRWQLANPHTGGMIAVGVGGSPIGRGGNLMVIDDPIKSYEAALSDTVRNKVNEVWFQGTMSSRLEPGATVIIICSRWHEEDLSGWLMANYPGDWDEVHIPALCDDPEHDVLGRQFGESFWPERWPTELLERRRNEVGPIVWQAQYQQRPSRPEGGQFPVGKLTAVPAGEVRWGELAGLCRAWDLAATEGDGDWTVGVLLGRYDDGRWIVLDVVRGQWGEATVRATMTQTRVQDDAQFGAGRVLVEFPQDPGQAGKAQAQQITAMLSGALVQSRPVTGSKEVRAAGLAAQVQMGNVDYLAGAPWVLDLVAELRAFPNAVHDDQVDALASAFNRLAGEPVVDAPWSSGIAAFRGLGRTNVLR